jgi:hypothetical protein
MTASTPSPTPQGIDWRVRLGVGATAVWLVLGALYVGGVVGWTDFVRHRAPELGEFLDGAFAPLAFLCGVIADAIRGGTHGRVARFITESRPAAA